MENNKIEFKLPLKKNNKITNIIYNISIDLVSKIIVFSLESTEIPKKIIHKGYSYSEMINNYNYFSIKEYFQDIESIYKQLYIYIENSKQNSSIELIEEESDKLELVIPTLVLHAPFLKFVFLNKIDTDSAITELSELYKKLKSEKEKEIDSLNQKINENEKKYDALQKEVALLKEEIINLKDAQTNKIKILENNFKEKIQKIKNEKENMPCSFKNKLDDLEKEINDNYDELNKTIEKIQSDMRTHLIYFALNNSTNFKTILENYCKLLKESGYLFLFDDKNSFDIINELIIDSIKGKNGTNEDKIVESDKNNYKKYTPNEWNWFLINNVIHQMFFNNNNGIQLNKNGVSETLEKIYKLNPDFKTNFKSELEKSKADIEEYVVDYKLCDIIKAIKIFIF